MKSRKLINIVLTTMMLLGFNATDCYAETTQANGKNGVSYMLLSTDFEDVPGVYRFNEYDGTKSTEPWRVFKTDTITGKVSGLAANQQNQVFLFSAPTRTGTEGFVDAPVGWLPTTVSFPLDSPIYLKAAKPNDPGLSSGYALGSSYVHGLNQNVSYSYWKTDYTINGTQYNYAVVFGGPTGVQYLNCQNGTMGTPVWDGSYWPSSTSNAAAIAHPDDPSKIILPSHFGALAYYLYGTSNAQASWRGKQLDGTNGLPTLIYSDSNKFGNWKEGITDSTHQTTDPAFACIVKRVYQTRNNDLDLYTGNDTTSANNHPLCSMAKTSSGVLTTKDVIVREYYGKHCGDNCIPGNMNDGGTIEGSLSSVTVVTTTRGNRYGFNPLGIPNTASATDASLRVVSPNGATSIINVADSNGNFNTSNITNHQYLSNHTIGPSQIKTIGVSSNFGETQDYIYGSAADAFVVQDSWWGLGGLAYEYTKGTDGNPGTVKKLDYMNNVNPDEEEVGTLDGKVDSIGIDGDGYLYALKTEEYPTDDDMTYLQLTNSPSNPSIITPPTNADNLPITSTTNTITMSPTWFRNSPSSDTVITVPDGQEQDGDYRECTFGQGVYKVIKRYAPATGGLGEEEDRGRKFVGHDYWTSYIRKINGSYQWDGVWTQENSSIKISDRKAELAVVNIAAAPKSIPGTTQHYIIVKGAFDQDGADMMPSYTPGQILSEQQSLEFKIEGYKPKVKEKEKTIQTSLKPVGSIYDTDGTKKYNNVYINNIPSAEGDGTIYEFDEDGDGRKSGFPSTMFEDKGTSMTTKVTWRVAQVEDTVAKPLSSAKIVNGIEETTVIDTDYLTLKKSFNQPGRYIIEAKVEYWYFDNYATAERPGKLTASPGEFVTEPMLISVYANSLRLNKSPSYITNITMTKNNSHVGTGVSGSSEFDCVEEGNFGDIIIGFDAQFYKEDNSNTTDNLQTYDGIGVWDYAYYKKLYSNIKSQCALEGLLTDDNLTVPSTERAYNHKSDTSVDSCYYDNKYNPGKLKSDGSITAATTYQGGTLVDTALIESDSSLPYNSQSKYDWQFIQWALYLIPIDETNISNQDDPDYPVRAAAYGEIEEGELYKRGPLIASGKCSGRNNANESYTTTDEARKYHVAITVPQSSCKIETPRDPKDYGIALEITYPRVQWLNNDLGAGLGDAHAYFSSVVPFINGESGNSPVHVISRIAFANGAADGNCVNHSFTEPGKTLFTEGAASFSLQVHDKEDPYLGPASFTCPTIAAGLDNTIALPYIETTGDPETPLKADINFHLYDNNPFLSIEKKQKSTAEKISREDASKAAYMQFQDLNEKKLTATKIYKNSFAAANDVNITETNQDSSFATTAKWEIDIEQTIHLDSLSPETFKASPRNTAPEDLPEKGTLKVENWIGELSYKMEGAVYDGYGVDNLYNVHQLTSEETPYLRRIDNDPPSIEVELISQTDNRRWVFRLIEGINDPESAPKTVSGLAPSSLVVKCLYLKNPDGDDTEQSVTPGPFDAKHDIPGTTGYNPPADCKDEVKVTEHIATAIPSFRRAARLLVNVNVLDNCGWLPLTDASISITDNVNSDKAPLSLTTMKLDASHADDGSVLPAFLDNKPRGVYVVDLPMKIAPAESQPQLELKVIAKDKNNNARTLIIPINLVESTFETRVLETKEQRE